MKLRLPHRLQAALVAALASVSFTTLSSGTLSAAFFFGSQAFAEEAADNPGATIDIGDTNLDAQAAIDEEEGKGEAKEPDSAPINQAGFNGIRCSSDDFDRQSTAEATTEASIDTENVGTADQANYTGTSADLPSNDLGFTANSYEASSDTSNGSGVDSPVTSSTQAPQIASAGGYSAAGTGSGSSSNKTSTGAIGSIGGTGSGAGGGGSFGSGISLGSFTKAAPTPVILDAASSSASNQTLHVYILTGQSNSLGAVKSTPLSQSKLDAYFTKGAMLWNANLRKGGDYYVPAAQQAWQDVVPQVPSYSTKTGEPSNLCMGPEYGFVHMLTRLSAEEKAPAVDADHLAIIKFSLDGGGNNYWDKNGSPTSYGTMLAAAERALLAAQTKGYTSISLDGLMYLQGESNSGAQPSAADTAYLTFVSNLSTDLENWMQQENITDITVSFDTNSVLGEPMLGTTDRQTTNNKFIALANRDEHIGYVYTDDLGNIGDNLHFTGEAQLTIGARYAYAFAVQNNYDVGAVRGANKSAALDTAGAWWMEDMPLSTDVVKWDVSSCSAVNTISSSLTVGGILVEDPYNNAVAITGGVLNIGTAGIELQKGSLSVSSAVNVEESQSWRSQNGYAINTTGNVTIASDATLTIQDGAVVNFHSIGGAGNLTLGTGSGLVSLGMSAQDFAAATPVGEAHYTEGDNGFFNGSRSIITVSGNLVIADGSTLGGMDGLTGAIFSVSDDHHSLYAAATSQTDYFVRSGKITYASGTNAYAATGLILVDKGSGDACLSLETNLKDNVSIQVSGTGNAIEIAEGVNLAAASLQIGGSGNVALKGNGFYTSNSVSHTGITLDPSNWHGVYMLKGVTIGTEDIIKNCTVGDSYVGLCGVSGVDNKWNGTQEANIWLQDNGDTVAWTWNNGSSNNFSTETFTGKIAGDGTLKKVTAKYKQNYTFKGDISDWTGTLWIADQNFAGTMTYQSAATVINSEIKNTSAQGITLVLGDTSDGTNAYTLNNSANVAILSADGRTLNLGTNEKADGTETVGNLTVSGNTTLGTLTLGSGTTATFGGTTNLAGVNGTGGTLVVGGGNLNVSGSVGGTVAINLQSGSVGNISIASGSNVTLSQAGGTYGIVSVAADTTLTLGSALNVADMTFGSGAKLDATVDFMRSVTYSGTSTGYSDNSDTVNGYQQYSDASFTLVTKSAGSAGTVQGAGLLESWTLVSTEDSVVAHGGTVKAGKYYVNTSVDYDAASSTNTAYTGASEMVLNSANATLNLLSNLNANACSGGITTAGGATAIASTINIGSGVTLNADQLTRKGSDTVTLAGSGTFAVAGINSTGEKFNAYDALPAGVSKGASWFGCLSLNGNIEQLWLNQAPGGSTVRLDGVTGFMGGSKSDNEQIVAEVEIGPGGYTFTTANTGTRNFKGGFSGTGNLVHANQGLENSPNLVFSSNMENFTGSIINQKASAGFTLNFNTGASVVNAASIKNDGTAANMLITMNVNDATTFNTLIDKGQGNINLTVASGKSATFNGNTSVSSLSASGADVALGSSASLAVAGATTVDNLSLAGGNTVAFGNGLSYNTLDAQGVSSMSLSGAVSMGEYLMLGKGTLSVNNVQLNLSRDAWDAALDREGSQYSDGESAVNGYATGMKLILARASRIDGAGYAAASGGSLAGMNLSIEVYGAEEDPECSVDGYAQHLVAMGADTSHTYFVNTEAEYDSSSATSSAATRLVMNRANASLSLASNLDSSVCVGGIVVEAQGTSVIVKSGVDLSAGDIHYGDTLTSICVEDQGTLVLEGFGGSAIALDRLTLEDGSALDLAALTTFAPAQQPVLLQGMGGGSGMMKVNSNAIGDFSGISLLGDAAPGSPQTVVLATASNGIELGSNVDLKNLVIPEQYQAKLSTQAAEGGGYNLVLTLGAASNDLIWDAGNGTWDVNNTKHWHTAVDPTSIVFNQGDNVTFGSGTVTATLGDNITAGNMTLNSGANVTVNTSNYSLVVSDLDSDGASLTTSGSGTATFGGSDEGGVSLSILKISGGTNVFNEHVTVTSNTRVEVTSGSVEFMNGLDYTGGNGHALVVNDGERRATLHGNSNFNGKSIGIGKTGTLTIAKDATVTAGAVENSTTFENNGALILEDGAVLTQSGVFKTTSLTLGEGAAVNMNGGNVTYKIQDISGAGNINITSQSGGRTYDLTGNLSKWTGTLTQTATSGNMNLNISGTDALNANIVNDATGAACNITVNLTHDMAVNGSINYTSAGPVHVNVGDSSHAVAVNFTNSVKAGSVKVQGASAATFAGGTGDLGSISLTSNNNGSAATTLRFSPNEDTGTGSYTASTIDMSSSGNDGLKWVIVDENATLQLTGTSLGSGGGASISNSWGVRGGGLEVNGTLTTAGTISMDSGGNQSTIKGSGQINTTGLNISNGNTTTIQGGVKVNITSNTGIYKRANNSTLNLADATLQAKEASWELKSNMGTVNLTNAATGTTFQADDGYTITVSKAMGGAGKLVKTGDGTLTLNTANAYSGGTEVNAGTLAVSNASGLGSGAVTLNSGMLDLSTAVTAGALTMSGGTLALDGSNWYTATTGNISLTGGTLDLTGFDLSSGAESYTLATATNGTVSTSGVTLALGTGYDPSLYSLGVQGNNLVLTFTQPAPTEDLIWHGGNGNWSSNNWHTETAPETRVPFADGLSVTFERGEAEVTLTQDVTAPTTTLESGAEVKVVPGSFRLNTTLKGAGTFVLAASQMALPSGVTLSSSTDWHGVVRINGTFNGLNIATLGNNIDSTIEFAGVTGHFASHDANIQTLSRDVIFTNAGDNNAAVYLNSGYSRDGAYQFAGKVSGSGTIEMNQEKTAYHFIFSGDVSHWDGEIKVTNCGSSNKGSWVKFTGSATKVNAAINQTGGGDFRVIADADTTFNDNIYVQRLEVTDGHTATLGGDVTLTGFQGEGITESSAVTVAQGGALTFASGVDTISGTLTVSEGATLKLSEMNDAAITTSGTLTLNSGSTLDLSSLTSITGRELTPITLVQQVQSGTITDTYLGGVNLVFARGVTGGKLSVQNSALVLTFIEPGKTLIWDNHAGNQTWSKGVDDTNWHTPNNLSRHIGFEEYDIVQFTGKVATSVIMAEDVTPARMEVASGKTLTVYTEGNDLTIVQDLNASGASVVLDSEGKQGQATSVGGDAVAGNLQIVGGSVDVRGYLDVENKATVTSDASLTAEHASNIGTLQVMGGTVDLKGKASVNSVELLEGMFPGSTSRATFESDSFVNALSVNSSELVNKGIMEMQNGAVMLSGTSSITGVGSINTASVRVVSGTTTIDGGQTINVTSAYGITGTGTLNLGNATLTANTRSWILANTVGVTLTDGDNGAKLSATDYTLTVASDITGTGKLVKTGTGTVELTGSNSYTGGTEVNAGTLLISSADALTGDVNVANGGRLRISDALVSSASAPSVHNLTVAQGGTLRLAGENALAVTGTLTMAAGSTLDLSHINIVDNKTTYTLASGGTFDVDAAVILTFGQGIHPKQGTTPSLTVEGDQGRQTLVLNYELNTPKNLIWDGGTANWNDDMTNWHAKEGSAGSSTFATYDNVIFDGTDIAGRGGDDTPTLSENVYATNMTVTKDNDVTVNTNGHRLDVDFLHAAEGSTITKTGTGTALIGIADNGFGADLTVTGGTLTAEYVDMNGAGMEVTGNLAADGGTLNVIIGRPETPTNIEFTSDSSVIALSSILVDANSTAVFNGAVSVPQNVTVEVRDGAKLVFGGNTNMSANRWLMTGEGSVHFTGPVTLSEETNNYEKIDGKLTVTFDDLTQGKANLTLRMQEGTDTNIGTLHLKGVQRCFYLTFQYDEQERGLLEIDTLDVADDLATHGIGSLCSKFGELQGYQQQGSISIAQLTGGGTVSLFNYAYDNNNAVGRIGYDSPEVFYVGGKSVEGKLFSGNIQLADGGFGVSEANKLKPKHTVLVLEDEIVASQSVIQINNADTGTGDNRNNGKYSNFGIGIDADNVKVQGIEDVAIQSGNQVKIFSGSVGTETNASYGSDDTVRTLQLTGKSSDTADTTYRSSAGFDKNVDIVKQGAGTQVFSGDSSKFNGSIEVQEGVLEFSNTASLHIEDLTLGKDKVQQPALMKSAPLKALGSDAANVDTLAVRTDAAGENVGMAEVNGTLKAKSGAALDSNLTLASGSTLDVRDTLSAETNPEMTDRTDYVGGLDMLGNTLTLQSGAYLSNEDRSALLSMQWGERYDLAYNVDSLTLGDTPYSKIEYAIGSDENIEASQYFQNLQEDDYYLCYSGSGAGPDGTNVGVFYIFKAPEPTTSTLSLLALAALAARRRRK